MGSNSSAEVVSLAPMDSAVLPQSTNSGNSKVGHARRNWTLAEKTWLMDRIPQYREAKAKGELKTFYSNSATTMFTDFMKVRETLDKNTLEGVRCYRKSLMISDSLIF